MPDKPELIYDSKCGFCRYWVVRWGHLTKDQINYARAEGRPGSVELADADGRTYNGAEAVFRALAHAPQLRVFLWMYKHIPLLAPLAECAYRCIASRRISFSAFLHRPEK